MSLSAVEDHVCGQDVGNLARGARDHRLTDTFTDQQIGQLYELMNAIRKKELAENDPEYNPPSRE